MSTFERLAKVFNTVFEDDVDVSSISDSTSLQKDMGISSIGMLYMAMALEEEFSIKFSNEDLMKLGTVADVIACIESKG
jgi:acyl carrier protein